MRHSKPLAAAAAGLAISLLGAPLAVSAGTIVGSAHDLSGFLPSVTTEICIYCHTPHNADTTVGEAPLWNHDLSSLTYTVYDSPTLDAGPLGQPDGISKLCLSCHDGSVAVDSFGGRTGIAFLSGDKAVGASGDLDDDHPISFVYDTALSTVDPGLRDPSAETVTIGSGSQTRTGTVQDILLSADKVQCSSCHDVHNTFVASTAAKDEQYLLKVTIDKSELCLECHDK